MFRFVSGRPARLSDQIALEIAELLAEASQCFREMVGGAQAAQQARLLGRAAQLLARVDDLLPADRPGA